MRLEIKTQRRLAALSSLNWTDLCDELGIAPFEVVDAGPRAIDRLAAFNRALDANGRITDSEINAAVNGILGITPRPVSPKSESNPGILLQRILQVLDEAKTNPPNVPSKTTKSKFKHDLFLSYSSVDRNTVTSFRTRLEDRGLKCWQDTAGVIAGDPLLQTIGNALSSCRGALIFVGKEIGKFQQDEISAISTRRRSGRLAPMIFVLLEDSSAKKNLPALLEDFRYLVLKASNRDEVANEIVEAVNRAKKGQKKL
jgi:hypothetical protein